jgi:hypothetical protein
MIFVDSGIWIAGKNQRDNIIKRLAYYCLKLKRKYGKSIISDYIIDEVLTFLNRKAGHKIALETLQFFELRETMI